MFPGKQFLIVDVLLRSQSATNIFYDKLHQESTVKINLLTQASQTKWEDLAKLTECDPEL